MKTCIYALLLTLSATLLPACDDASAPEPVETQTEETADNTDAQSPDAQQAEDADPSTWVDPVVVTLIHEQVYRHQQDPDNVEMPAQRDGHGPVTILINDNRVEDHMLVTELNALAEQDPARPVLVRVDPMLYYSTLTPTLQMISNTDFTGPMHMENITELEVPAGVAQDAEPNEPSQTVLTIAIDPATAPGSDSTEMIYDYTVNGEPVMPDALRQTLEAIAQADPGTQLVLNAQGNIPHGKMVEVMDLAAEVGITDVALAVRVREAD